MMNIIMNSGLGNYSASNIQANNQPKIKAQIFDEHIDSLGQKYANVPLGELRRETSRLASYLHFPKANVINLRWLASEGFSYTGYDDRVKCFSCNRCVHKFETARHAPFFSDWHTDDCAFMNGTDRSNEPLSSLNNTILKNNTPVARSINVAGPSNNASIQTASNQNRSLDDTSVKTHSNNVGEQLLSNFPPQAVNRLSFKLAVVENESHLNLLKSLNLAKEDDRLRTFSSCWPYSTSRPTPHSFAKSGFFYLGNNDRTQCFSCSMVLKDWEYSDDVDELHRSYSPTCQMAKGNCERNIPRHNYYAVSRCLFRDGGTTETNEVPHTSQMPQSSTSSPQVLQGNIVSNHVADETTSNERQQNASSNNIRVTLFQNGRSARELLSDLGINIPRNGRSAEAILNESGFNVVQNARSTNNVMDNIPPHNSPTNEIPNDEVADNISVSIPPNGEPVTININDIGNNTSQNNAEPLQNQSGNVNFNLREQLYPCNAPVRPRMRQIENRLQSFRLGNYRHNTQGPTIQAIAEAGFYSVNKEDKVTCWYCDGGLYRWNPGEQPWVEHAKWYPTCEFLLREKGEMFVQDIVSQNPNLQRPQQVRHRIGMPIMHVVLGLSDPWDIKQRKFRTYSCY